MTKFYPELLMSIGATSAFYTLRETYESHGQIRSYHIQNLSQDFDEAFSKMLYISLESGTPMRQQCRETLERELRDIVRSSKEQREALALAQAQREAMWAAEREARRFEVLDAIKNGVILFGTFNQYNISDLPIGYANWLMDTNASFEEGSYIRALSDELLANYQYMRLPTPHNEFFGAEKDKVAANVTVTRTGSYSRACFNAPWLNEEVYIVTMVDDSGYCFVSKSPNFKAKVGDKFSITAKVKKHDSYNGQSQTVVNYVKAFNKIKEAA